VLFRYCTETDWGRKAPPAVGGEAAGAGAMDAVEAEVIS
jgi:hypothetical protein